MSGLFGMYWRDHRRRDSSMLVDKNFLRFSEDYKNTYKQSLHYFQRYMQCRFSALTNGSTSSNAWFYLRLGVYEKCDFSQVRFCIRENSEDARLLWNLIKIKFELSWWNPVESEHNFHYIYLLVYTTVALSSLCIYIENLIKLSYFMCLYTW